MTRQPKGKETHQVVQHRPESSLWLQVLPEKGGRRGAKNTAIVQVQSQLQDENTFS